MYYLIKCNHDNSYCTVEDYEVVFDKDNPPAVNSSVSFYWKNEKYLGTIVDSSNDDAELQESAKKLAKKRKNLNTENESPLPEKRLRKPKKSWSFTKDEKLPSPVKTKKKVLSNKADSNASSSNVKQQVKNLIYKNQETPKKSKSPVKSPVKSSESDEETNSPTKEELKKIILEQKKLLDSGEDSKLKSRKVKPKFVISDSDDSNDSSKDDDDDEKREEKNDSDDKSQKVEKSGGSDVCNPQLYGKNSGEPLGKNIIHFMILLKNNIYCTKKAFDDAVDYNRKTATSFLRRLMDGVFKPTAILKCTYSGRPPNAQGKERQSIKVEALDRDAKKAVLDFCEDYASKQGWPKVSPAKMRRTMSQWVGENKREISKNTDNDCA